MFRNKILSINSVKLSRNKVNQKVCGSIDVYYLKSRGFSEEKMRDGAFLNLNGFTNTISLKQNLADVKNFQKYLSSYSSDKCWKCKEDLKIKQFSCSSCGALQYPKPNVNFFEVLGISQAFDVDLEDLSKKFKNLQMIFHPDKFANRSEEEQKISESYSTLLNKAYTTLKDPFARGIYMLELQKIKIETDFEMEPPFLIFIMEKNEELECLGTVNSLTQFMETNNEEMDKHVKIISESFRYSDLEKAKLNLMKLNYFRNLDKKIKEKQQKLIDAK